MVHNLGKRVANFFLPFSVSAKNCAIGFSDEMEMATMLHLAEAERKKERGLVLKKTGEELVFISKFRFPIWLVPWRGKTLFFDGLGASTHTLTYEALPDVKAFINDIQGSVDKRQAYSAALVDHIQYFQSVKGTEEKPIPNLVANPEFIHDFTVYLAVAEAVKESRIKGEARLPPIVNESSISLAVQELSELRTILEKDRKGLRDCMKLLSNTTRKHANILRDEIRQTRADFKERVAAAKAMAMEKVRKIQEKYDSKILKISQRLDQQLHKLHKNRVKLEKSKDYANKQIGHCEAEANASKVRKDAAAERRWREEKEKWKREVATLEEEIKGLNKRIEETESEKKHQISVVRSEFKHQAELAMTHVRELEAARDAKIQLRKQEMKSLEETTSTILEQLDKLDKRKRSALQALEKIGMRKRRRNLALVYTPFYLACFRAEDQRRYMMYPPSIVGSIGVLTKFRGILGASRLRLLFQQRSKAITQLLNRVVDIIEHDPALKRNLDDIGGRVNILRTRESCEGVKTGLEELRNEGLISENEFQTLDGLIAAK